MKENPQEVHLRFRTFVTNIRSLLALDHTRHMTGRPPTLYLPYFPLSMNSPNPSSSIPKKRDKRALLCRLLRQGLFQPQRPSMRTTASFGVKHAVPFLNSHYAHLFSHSVLQCVPRRPSGSNTPHLEGKHAVPFLNSHYAHLGGSFPVVKNGQDLMSPFLTVEGNLG